MRKHTSIISVVFAAAIWAIPFVAASADCASKAQNLAAQESAELLNVADLGNGQCEVTLRIPGKNGGPPRVVSKTVSG